MAFSSSDEFPNEGEDLSKGSSFNGVTGLRAREGKSSKLGERISGLFLGEKPGELFRAKLGIKVLSMRLFLRLFLLS